MRRGKLGTRFLFFYTQYLILEVEHELDFIVVFDIYTSSVAV